jgi:hypothetical protein
MVLMLRVAMLASRTPRIFQQPYPSILHQVGSYRTYILMLDGLNQYFPVRVLLFSTVNPALIVTTAEFPPIGEPTWPTTLLLDACSGRMGFGSGVAAPGARGIRFIVFKRMELHRFRPTTTGADHVELDRLAHM